MSRGAVVWITGLPGSGKSTLAASVRARLADSGRPCVVLDGDEVRPALVPPPGYDADGRANFYATLGNLATLLARQGLVVLVAATAHLRRWRDGTRQLTGRFVEVFVDVPAEECERRDPKGLYARARAGAAPDLPGVGPGYETPVSPEVVAGGGRDEKAVDRIVALVNG